MRVFYRGREFLVLPGVYEPAEDTFLLADHLEVKEGERVLELGTGCGILAVLAAEQGGRVVATDVSEAALRCAWLNAWRHGVGERVELRRGELFSPVGSSTFDLILFNPPYLPEEGEGDPRWSGGRSGRGVLDPFLSELPLHLSPGGRALFVQSSLSGVEESLRRLGEGGLEARILKRLRFFFEELVLVEAGWNLFSPPSQ
jgi:release factor glutamine methyltransferase